MTDNTHQFVTKGKPMRAFRLTVAIALLLAQVAFAQEDLNKFITKSHLNKIPPEIESTASPRVNADDDLTLNSLRGRIVLLLFTSTG